jgi:hypothetical protein
MRCSIACIIPPALLEELVRRTTDDEERDALLRTLSLDASLRTARVHNSLTAARRNRATIRQSATAGRPQRTIYDCHGLEPPSDPEQVRAEGDPPSDDVTVNEAYDGLGDTYARSTGTSTPATRSTTRACRCTAGSTTAATTTTRSGTARR